jgi:hypothetical protein
MREIQRARRKRAGGVIPSARFMISAFARFSISIVVVYTCVYMCGREERTEWEKESERWRERETVCACVRQWERENEGDTEGMAHAC